MWGPPDFVVLGDNQFSGAIGLPFPVDFFGVTYNELYIHSNGFITFDSIVFLLDLLDSLS